MKKLLSAILLLNICVAAHGAGAVFSLPTVPSMAQVTNIVQNMLNAGTNIFITVNADGTLTLSAGGTNSLGGVGDVASSVNFGTDNLMLKSDGVNKNIQATGNTIDDNNVVTANITTSSALANAFIFKDPVTAEQMLIKFDGTAGAPKFQVIGASDVSGGFSYTANTGFEVPGSMTVGLGFVNSGNTTLGASDASLNIFHGQNFFYGRIAFASPAIIETNLAASVNNWAPSGFPTVVNTFYLTSSSDVNITGLGQPTYDTLVFIYNKGSYAITLAAESASSTAANRFGMPDDIVLSSYQGAILRYDTTSDRWRIFTSGSGGSGSITTTSDLPVKYTVSEGSSSVTSLNTSWTTLASASVTARSGTSGKLFFQLGAIVDWATTAGGSVNVRLYDTTTATVLKTWTTDRGMSPDPVIVPKHEETFQATYTSVPVDGASHTYAFQMQRTSTIGTIGINGPVSPAYLAVAEARQVVTSVSGTGGGGGGATTAGGISVAFTPTNYTPVTATAEGNFIGIDSKIGEKAPSANPAFSGSYGLISAGAILRRTLASGNITNIFYPTLTNLLAEATLQNNDHILLSGSHDIAAHSYSDDASSLTLSSQAGYFQNLTNLVIEGKPYATINITNYGNGLTFENCWHPRVTGIHFTQLTNGLSASTPIAAMIGQRQTNAFLEVDYCWFDDSVDQVISQLFADLNRPAYGQNIHDNIANDIGTQLQPYVGQHDGSFVSGSPRLASIRNNWIYGENWGPVIEFDGSGVGHTNDYTIGDTLVEGNHISGAYSQAIVLFNASSNITRRVKIVNNWISGSTNNFLNNRGIVHVKGGTDILIEGNYIEDQIKSTASGANSLIAVVKDATFAAPTISTNVSIIDNRLEGGAYGAIIQEGVQGVNVQGNKFHNQGGPSLQIWANGFDVSGNHFNGSGRMNISADISLFNNDTQPLDNGMIHDNIFHDYAISSPTNWLITASSSYTITNVTFYSNKEEARGGTASALYNVPFVNGRVKFQSPIYGAGGIQAKQGSTASPGFSFFGTTNGWYYSGGYQIYADDDTYYHSLSKNAMRYAPNLQLGWYDAGKTTLETYFSKESADTISVGTSGNQNLHANTVTAGGTGFVGSGAGVTSLNASQLSSGTVPTARLGSGTADSTTFLRGDNTWTTVSGSGDVTAASAFGTDNVLIRSDGTGKGVQATGITVDDSDNMAGLASVTTTNLNVGSGGIVFSGATITDFLDEDNMASDSATAGATQQSIKAYVDAGDATKADAGAITSSGLTMSTARLLGRTTASTGAPEEITVGAGLTLSAGALTATAGATAINDIGAATGAGAVTVGANQQVWTWDGTSSFGLQLYNSRADDTTDMVNLLLKATDATDANTIFLQMSDNNGAATAYQWTAVGSTFNRPLTMANSSAITPDPTAGIAFPSVTVTDVLDEDAMTSNSATKLATQQSIKAYVDAQVGTPTTTRGDLIRRGSSADERLALGRPGSIVVSDGTDALWTDTVGRFYWEFFDNNTSGTMGTSVANGGSAGSFQAAEAGHVGIWSAVSGTSANGSAAILTAQSTVLLGGTFWHDLTWYIKTPVASDGTDTYELRVGFNDASSGDAVDGAYFLYTDTGLAGATDGQWLLRARDNSSSTDVDSNTSVTGSTWYRLRIHVADDGSSATFYVDGTSIGTVTGGLPTGIGRYTRPSVSITKTAGTTSRTALVDDLTYIFEKP